MDREVNVLDVPLLYTYFTRLRGVRGLLVYAAYEMVPCALAVSVVGAAAAASAICLFIGFVAIYEIGYLFNDARVQPAEVDGRRLSNPTYRATPGMFVGSRMIVAAVMAAIAHTLYPSTDIGSYALLLTATSAILILHSTAIVVERGFRRIGTFAALAFGKYAVYLLPVLGYRNSLLPLLSIFALYGFPRTVMYTIRKYGRESANGAVADCQVQVQILCLIFTGPAILPLLGVSKTPAESVALVLWLAYAGIVVVTGVGRRLRRRSGPLSIA